MTKIKKKKAFSILEKEKYFLWSKGSNVAAY